MENTHELSKKLGEEKNEHGNYKNTSIPKSFYLDNVGSKDEKIQALTRSVNSLLSAINNKYCKLIDSGIYNVDTPRIQKSKNKFFEFFSTDKKLKVETELEPTKKQTEPLTFETLQNGRIAVGDAVKFTTGEDGRLRLCQLLSVLRDVKSIKELLQCVANSGCLDGGNFLNEVGPTLLEMHYLETVKPLRFQHETQRSDIKEMDIVGKKIKIENNEKYFLSVSDTAKIGLMNGSIHQLDRLAVLVCEEAAGKLNIDTEHTVQQLANHSAPEYFKGEPDRYEEIQDKIDRDSNMGPWY